MVCSSGHDRMADTLERNRNWAERSSNLSETSKMAWAWDENVGHRVRSAAISLLLPLSDSPAAVAYPSDKMASTSTPNTPNEYRRSSNTWSKQGSEESPFGVLNALHPFPHVEQRFKYCLPRGIFALGPMRTIGGGCCALCVLRQPLD